MLPQNKNNYFFLCDTLAQFDRLGTANNHHRNQCAVLLTFVCCLRFHLCAKVDCASVTSSTHKRVAPPTVYRALDFLLEQGFNHQIKSLNAFLGCPTPHLPHKHQSHEIGQTIINFIKCMSHPETHSRHLSNRPQYP